MKSAMMVLICAAAIAAAATAEAGGGGHRGRHRNRRGKMKPVNRGKGEYLQGMFEKLDADGNGTISKEEFPGPDRKFDRIDADGNGEISREELKQLAAQRHKIKRQGEDGKRLKKKQDTGT